MDPREIPNHEKKKPQPKPNAFTLAMTNRDKGKNGRKAFENGNNIPVKGPKERYWSINSTRFSSVNHSLIE